MGFFHISNRRNKSSINTSSNTKHLGYLAEGSTHYMRSNNFPKLALTWWEYNFTEQCPTATNMSSVYMTLHMWHQWATTLEPPTHFTRKHFFWSMNCARCFNIFVQPLYTHWVTCNLFRISKLIWWFLMNYQISSNLAITSLALLFVKLNPVFVKLTEYACVILFRPTLRKILIIYFNWNL